MQGFEIIPRIIEIHPPAGILALTNHKSREIASRAIALGAPGLVLKSDGLRDVIQGIQALARGKSTMEAHSSRSHVPGAANPETAGGRQKRDLVSFAIRHRIIGIQ
jgi:DNA-binding NarL/FixJ family response regulator